jgi:hypothetical protein
MSQKTVARLLTSLAALVMAMTALIPEGIAASNSGWANTQTAVPGLVRAGSIASDRRPQAGAVVGAHMAEVLSLKEFDAKATSQAVSANTAYD